MNYLLKKTTGPARLKMPRRCWRKKKYTEGNALRPRLCRAGFTLIELLVVIAIIAILASILLPALRKSIKEAREVVCMNNIHQLCVAATTYKEDYYGDYPPPVIYVQGTGSKVHPHDLKASDIGFIAPYIGENPSRFDDSTPLEEGQFPAVMRCPFGKFWRGVPGAADNVHGDPVGYYYLPGYAYFGNLEWLPPGSNPCMSVPDAFKLKYASRNCAPDAALWGDTVSSSYYTVIVPSGTQVAGYTHGYSDAYDIVGTVVGFSGPFWGFWKLDSAFTNFERQNLGYVDGSVKIRMRDEVNPQPFDHSGAGLRGGGIAYSWWF